MSNLAKKNTFILRGLLTGFVTVLIHAWQIHNRVDARSLMQLALHVPLFIGIIVNAFLFSRANHGYVSFGKIFLSCFYVALIVMVIRLIWIPVSVHLFPDMKAHLLSEMRMRYDKSGVMDENATNHITSAVDRYWTTITIVNVFFNTLLFGAIFALVGAAIAPKKVMTITPEN